MKRLIDFPVILLRLPFMVRLGSVILVFLMCQILNLFIAPITHEGSIVVIPIALAAWLFRYRGLLLGILLTELLMTALDILILKFYPTTSASLLSALVGFIVAIAIGSMVAYLRSMVDIVETARHNALLAEQQIQEAYEQQERLLEQKDLFLTNINHELRSPLTVLYGSLELLKQEWGDNSPLSNEFQRMWFDRAVESCESLMLLTNQALSATFVNHDVPVPQLEEVSVAAVIQELLDSGDPRIVRLDSICLKLAEQVTAWADREYLSQILWNVLSNASLYCPPGTAVTISATTREELSNETDTCNQLCICVKDEGPGIPAEEITNLFSPFVRLKRDVAQSLPGSGLGLYISKRLAEAMDGRLWVESSGKKGEGSCFYLTLPVMAPALHV